MRNKENVAVESVKRVLGHLSIIVAGVLLALLADSWMQGRKDRDEEAVYLDALSRDFAASRDDLESSIKAQNRIAESLTKLLEEDLSAAPSDAIGRWAFAAFFLIGAYEPSLTAMSEMESSGRLGLLEPDLRLRLAELDKLVSVLAKQDADVTKIQQGLIDPFVVKQMPIAATWLENMKEFLDVKISSPAAPDWSPVETEEARSMAVLKLVLVKVGLDLRRQMTDKLAEAAELADRRLQALR